MQKPAPKNKLHHVSLVLVALIIFGATLGILAFYLISPSSNGFKGKIAEFCANSISCINNLTGKPDTSNVGTFMGQTVTAPPIQTDSFTPPAIPTPTPDNHKHIEVDLTHQKLYAYEGDKLVYSFLISSGKYYVTPTGDFTIWIKLRYTRMVGGSKENNTYYDLPNVPYTMYFYNSDHPKDQGYAIHGAYWHHNFGHPMSHGCINLSPQDAKLMYDWANPSTTSFVTYATDSSPGTSIHIYGVTPKN